MSYRPFASPARTLPRPHTDNLALLPGNLLPFIDHWQERANRLPQKAVLIVLPSGPSIPVQTMLAVAKHLAAKGWFVRVVIGTA